MIEVNAIKVSIPIRGEDLPTDMLPAEGAPGSAKAVIEIRVKGKDMAEGFGGELVAPMKAKTYREVLKKVADCENGAWAILQGKLGSDGVLRQAGFVVQPSTPREPKVEEPAHKL